MSDRLKRLIEAAAREIMIEEAVLADPVTLRLLKARRVVRAVLMELRTPTGTLLKAAYEAASCDGHWDIHDADDFVAAWQAGVDALLREPEP